jgi:hypothetical protein
MELLKTRRRTKEITYPHAIHPSRKSQPTITLVAHWAKWLSSWGVR